MSFNAKHSGTFKLGVPNAKHANIWKPAKEWWENVSNVWVKRWSSLAAIVSGYFTQVTQGGTSVYDRATLTVVTTPASTPTAWAWEFSDSGGFLVPVGGSNSSSFVLRGTFYDYTLPTTTFSVTVWCTVTIAGQTIRTADRTLDYMVGGFV